MIIEGNYSVVLFTDLKRAKRAMRSAIRQGFDPYNSATVQAAKYHKATQDAIRRGKA